MSMVHPLPHEGLAKEREYNEVVLKSRLRNAMAKLNPGVQADAQETTNSNSGLKS